MAKTQLMMLGKRNQLSMVEQVRIRDDGDDLPKLDSVRNLCVMIDKDLNNWKLHIDDVRQKCLVKLAMIRRAGVYFSPGVKKLLYQSFV